MRAGSGHSDTHPRAADVNHDASRRSSYGLYGNAYGSGTGTKYGVYGTVSGSGTLYAGYFSGNMTATGTKSFQIDHPLDPENWYLNHYCAEGPEPLNTYSGIVVLDGSGQAWVELPDYFETINRDFRYQLTAIGAAMPNLHVGAEVKNNVFLIAGGEPGMKVSWAVTGVRNDPYVRMKGAPVELPKSPEEQGFYLHPEAYGLPETAGLDYAHYWARVRDAK